LISGGFAQGRCSCRLTAIILGKQICDLMIAPRSD
jgi:hypothetical protein